MGGYDANFDPPLEDKYKCPVCLTALKDPIQTKCGHRLCSTCFKTIRGGNWYFRCPVDNTWSNHVFEDNAVKREVLSLTVTCNNTSCKWLGELRELQSHLKQCEYEKIECPNKCKSEIMRIELEKHMSECPLRLETCEHCQIQIVVSQLAHHHVLMCPKLPVNCTVCGEAKISRDNMNSHTNIINGDCPMVVIPCSFRHIGCMFQDKRAKMAKHYADANTHHLMLLSTRLVDMEMKHRLDLQVTSEKFEQNLNALLEKFNELQSKYGALEKELVDNKTNVASLSNSLKNLRITIHSNELFNQRHSNPILSALTSSSTQTNTSVQMSDIYKWTLDLSVKRKAHYSPSYCLPNTGYKVHLWLQPEIQLAHDNYSTICVILERCDNEEELPVCFDCCFYLTCSAKGEIDADAQNKQLKCFATTDAFHMSGHVSKPMTLFKTNDLMSFACDDKKLDLELTIRPIKEMN